MRFYGGNSEIVRLSIPDSDVLIGALAVSHARTNHPAPETLQKSEPVAVESLDYLFDPADEQDWQEHALCGQTDPEAFFPEKGGSTRDAKRICLGCEVRSECLEYALAHNERFGIWGGLSERERRKLQKPST